MNNAMEKCRRCVDGIASADELIRVLENPRGLCGGCGDIGVMTKLSNQYRMRKPRWWVVDGVVVVPTWMVDAFARWRA